MYNFTIDEEEAAHLHFSDLLSSVSSASPEPWRQSWPTWKGKRVPVHPGRHGLELVLLSLIKCSGMSEDTYFPMELEANDHPNSVYLHY